MGVAGVRGMGGTIVRKWQKAQLPFVCSSISVSSYFSTVLQAYTEIKRMFVLLPMWHSIHGWLKRLCCEEKGLSGGANGCIKQSPSPEPVPKLMLALVATPTGKIAAPSAGCLKLPSGLAGVFLVWEILWSSLNYSPLRQSSNAKRMDVLGRPHLVSKIRQKTAATLPSHLT